MISKPIAFIHIPKCSGSSFLTNLMSLCASKNEFYQLHTHKNINIRGIKNLSKLPKNIYEVQECDISKIKFFFPDHTNINFSDLNNCNYNTRLFDYATILREPVQRFLSGYYYIKRYSKKDFVEYECSYRLSREEKKIATEVKDLIDKNTIDEILNDNNKIALINQSTIPHIGFNVQAKMLAGVTGYATDNYKMENSEFDNDDKIFNRAMLNLKKIKFVGIVEKYSISLAYFSFLFNFNLCKAMKDNIFQGKKPSLSEESMQKIRSFEYLDIKLYNYAKENFLDKIKDISFIEFINENMTYQVERMGRRVLKQDLDDLVNSKSYKLIKHIGSFNKRINKIITKLK